MGCGISRLSNLEENMPISDETNAAYIKALDEAQAFQIIYVSDRHRDDVLELNQMLVKLQKMYMGKEDVDALYQANRISNWIKEKCVEVDGGFGSSHANGEMKMFLRTRHVVTDTMDVITSVDYRLGKILETSMEINDDVKAFKFELEEIKTSSSKQNSNLSEMEKIISEKFQKQLVESIGNGKTFPENGDEKKQRVSMMDQVGRFMEIRNVESEAITIDELTQKTGLSRSQVSKAMYNLTASGMKISKTKLITPYGRKENAYYTSNIIGGNQETYPNIERY